MQALPTVDVRQLEGAGSNGSADAFVASLGRALLDYGFVSVIGADDISEALTSNAYAAMRRFFALPEQVKRSYHVPGGGGELATRRSASSALRAKPRLTSKSFGTSAASLPKAARIAFRKISGRARCRS